MISWSLELFFQDGISQYEKVFFKSLFSQVSVVLKQTLFLSLNFSSSFLVLFQRTQKQSSLGSLFLGYSLPVYPTCGLNRLHQQWGWEAEQAREEGSCCPNMSFWISAGLLE